MRKTGHFKTTTITITSAKKQNKKHPVQFMSYYCSPLSKCLVILH